VIGTMAQSPIKSNEYLEKSVTRTVNGGETDDPYPIHRDPYLRMFAAVSRWARSPVVLASLGTFSP
jgi:hypothetical protein